MSSLKRKSDIISTISNKKMKENSLYDTHPQLREEWDGDVDDMKNYATSSNKKVQWKCKTGNTCHKWPASIAHRTETNKPRGCPFCSGHATCSCDNCPNLYNNFPHLREEWIGDVNDMKNCAIGTHKKVQWKCKTGSMCHKWTASIKSRTGKLSGCPFCCGKKICSCENCPNLYNNFPHLREEWNGDVDDMKNCAIGSKQKVEWKCKTENTHKWTTSIFTRTKMSPTGCPHCLTKTEDTLFKFLIECLQNSELVRQYSPDWVGRKRYDFYIPSHHTIIELDGPQHFEQISNWDDPKLTQESDIFKMSKAKENNLNAIRLLQTEVADNTNESWKTKLINILLECKNSSNANIYCIANDMSVYAHHINKV